MHKIQFPLEEPIVTPSPLNKFAPK